MKNIQSIIDKYWNGESSLEEENQLSQYIQSGAVDKKHAYMVPLFNSYAIQREIRVKDLDIATITTSSEVTQDIDILLDKYWNAETDLDEETVLVSYFESNNVEENHLQYQQLFLALKEEKKATITLDSDFMKTHINENESKVTKEVTLPKRNKVRYLWPKLAGIAASLVFLMMTTVGSFDNNASYKHKYTELDKAAETKEAMALTMEALSFLSNNYEKGSKPMKQFKKLEKTAVFKFN